MPAGRKVAAARSTGRDVWSGSLQRMLGVVDNCVEGSAIKEVPGDCHSDEPTALAVVILLENDGVASNLAAEFDTTARLE